jgi:hypothetical protein
MAVEPKSGPGLPFLGYRNNSLFYGAELIVQRSTPYLEDQASVFLTPGDRVARTTNAALDVIGQRLIRFSISVRY